MTEPEINGGANSKLSREQPRNDLSSHIPRETYEILRIYNLYMDLLKESTLHEIEEEINFVIIFQLRHILFLVYMSKQFY